MEPPAPAPFAAPWLPACAVDSAALGARLAARRCSCAAALGPIRLGEVHRGASARLKRSVGSAVSAASPVVAVLACWVQEAVGPEAGVAADACDAPPFVPATFTEPALEPTGSWPTHSPLPAGPVAGATIPVTGVTRPATGAMTGASGAVIGAIASAIGAIACTTGAITAVTGATIGATTAMTGATTCTTGATTAATGAITGATI
jgi:hypothetical protein